jgi:hypothetical protein
MFSIATVVYLPNHVAIISRRLYYYFAGDAELLDNTRTVASSFGGSASKASEALVGAASDFAGAAYQAAVNTAEAATRAAENLGWN